MSAAPRLLAGRRRHLAALLALIAVGEALLAVLFAGALDRLMTPAGAAPGTLPAAGSIALAAAAALLLQRWLGEAFAQGFVTDCRGALYHAVTRHPGKAGLLAAPRRRHDNDQHCSQPTQGRARIHRARERGATDRCARDGIGQFAELAKAPAIGVWQPAQLSANAAHEPAVEPAAIDALRCNRMRQPPGDQQDDGDSNRHRRQRHAQLRHGHAHPKRGRDDGGDTGP